jgi:hypothetical protein
MSQLADHGGRQADFRVVLPAFVAHSFFASATRRSFVDTAIAARWSL